MSCTNFLVLSCIVTFVFALHAVDAQKESSHPMGDSPLEVAAYWEPGTESWLKLYTNSQYAKFFDLKPGHPTKQYTADEFNVFLPPSEDNLAVGDVWQFDIEDTLPFLRQFHPGSTVDLSGRRGAFACLRALSPGYAEIVFRFHADFNMEILKEAEELQMLESVVALAEELGVPMAELERLRAEFSEAEDLRDILEGSMEELKAQSQELADSLLELEQVQVTPSTQNPEFTELKRDILKLSTALAALNMSLKNQSALLNTRMTKFEQELDSGFTELNAKLENKLADFQADLKEQSEILTKRLDSLNAQVAELNTAHAYNTGIYFTPSQFIGRLLVNRDTGAIQAFSLGILSPPGNATLFAFGGVDVVSVPQMELVGKSSIDEGEIAWTTAIAPEAADGKLRLQFIAERFRPNTTR